ncbi:MAG: hypothetical protein ACYTA3_04350, partial [Planctomycetota bacterium]
MSEPLTSSLTEDYSKVQEFFRRAKEAGASFEQATSYLQSRGVFTPGAPAVQTPEVSPFRQQLEDRIVAAEEQGAMRTVPSPGFVGPQEPVKSGFTKTETAALGNVLQIKQLSDLHMKLPLVAAAGAPGAVAAIGFGEGMRAAGYNVPWETDETRALYDTLRMAEEETMPGGLVSKEGMQVMGLQVLLDPLNVLPGVGFADTPLHIANAMGRRIMGKGLLSADDFAKAFSSGIAEEVWGETERFMRGARKATMERWLTDLYGPEQAQVLFDEIGEEVVTQAVADSKAIDMAQSAIDSTKKYLADEVSATTAEYFDALHQEPLFRAARGQTAMGFVEPDPRLAHTDAAKLAADLTDESVPSLNVRTSDALRKRLQEAFPEKSKKEIQKMLDESNEIAQDFVKTAKGEAAAGVPDLPGGSAAAAKARLLESGYADEVADTMIEEATRAATRMEKEAVTEADLGARQMLIEDVPGRITPPQTLYKYRETLLKGYERTLAELYTIRRAHEQMAKNKVLDAKKMFDTDNPIFRARMSDAAEEIIEKEWASGDLSEMARKAVSETYNTIIDYPKAPTRDNAKFLYKVGIEEAGKVAAEIAEGVEPAGIKRMNGLKNLLWRAAYRMQGGAEAEFLEGSLRAAAHEYTDKGVRDLLTRTWPEMYRRYKGEVSQMLFDANVRRSNVAREISRVASERGVGLEVVGRELNKARTSGDPSAITDTALRDAFKEATVMIDGLSLRFAKEGLIPEKDFPKIADSLGKYFHLNYAAFNVSNWKKRIADTAVWENAFQWFHKHYPKMSDAEISGTMMYMLGNRKKIVFGKGVEEFASSLPGNLPVQVLDELKARKHIPAELRDLLGLNEDFLANFDITSAKLVKDLEVTKFQRKLLDSGLKSGVLRVTKDLPDPVVVKFDRLMKGREIYADRRLAELLGAVDGMAQKEASFLGVANGIVKAMKIVPSPGTQARNVISLPIMWMANGSQMIHAANLGTRIALKGNKVARMKADK